MSYHYVPSNGSKIAFREDYADLPGEMWVITSYFNNKTDSSILQNYYRFAENLRKYNIKLLTIELSYKEGAFSLNKKDADLLLQVSDADVMWQKERLYNIAVKALPANVDKVVFLDADTLFADPDWFQKTGDLLEKYHFIQPFSRSVRLTKDNIIHPITAYESGFSDGQFMHCYTKGIELFGNHAFRIFPHHGEVGLAVAARRSTIQKHGWYDADIVGLGDLLTLNSVFQKNNLRTDHFHRGFNSHFRRWQKKFRAEVSNSMYYIDGDLHHLWHGDGRNRFYSDRTLILSENMFNPKKDICLSAQGCWKWNSNKPDLHSRCEQYFFMRDDK